MEQFTEKNSEESLKEFHKQVREGSKLGEGIDIHQKIDSIVIAAMGGSAIPGMLLKSYLEKFPYPVEVVKDYALPAWASKHTLVVAISYSGNTEETLTVFQEAMKRGCLVVGMSSGGKLMAKCRELRKPHVKVPRGYMPRFAIGLQFMALLNLLQNAGLIPSNKEELQDCVESLQNNMFQLRGKELAELAKDKLPIIYSSRKMESLAYVWKISINETANSLAIANVFPELNHNEMQAFETAQPDVQVFILKVEDDPQRIQKRMTITKDIVKWSKAHVVEIAITGKHRLTKIFSAVLLGLWTGYYLAEEYQVSPDKIELIEEFKKKLKCQNFPSGL